MAAKSRVYSYLRFSDPKQAAGGSIDRQLEYAARWAADHEMELDASLSLRDEGLSAYHQRHVRQGALGVFLRAIEDSQVPAGSVLIVEGLDRLSRAEPLQAQAQLAQIVNAGITVVTASDGREYNRERLKAQPMDLVYSLLVMIRAHEESDTKSKRVKAAIRRQCQGWIAGTWRAPIRVGRDPHWVREIEGGGFELIPERASAVQLAIQMFKQGHGAVQVVRELAARGLKISETGRTHSSNIYKILANRMLIGEKTVEVEGETFRLEGYYPALLTPAEFADLRYLAEQRGRRKGKGEIPGVVTGLGITYCGYCGAAIVAQNLMGRKRLPDGRPYPGHRRLHCVTYSQGAGCKISGSCSVVPVERALMLYCSDQMNLTRLLEGDASTASVSAQLASARQRVAELEAQVRRVTDALLLDDGEAPAAVLKRLRELESQLAGERREVDSLEHHLAASASVVAPAAADAWRELVHGVEQLDYDARMMARQLVADTFSRIVIYQSGFRPGVDSGAIGVVLIGKRGNTRMLNVDRRSGEWRAAEDLAISETTSIPLPTIAHP
ncbi:recombinase family protein [Burkholderia stagnalis]|uniref:Integrase n=1 Tax=Burkholderia stagnalis TaxID=1503054 RepID=A0A107T9C2_9BURK|nr:recombinase family protein [Burkholderia stagnalis]KVZ03398.1 integrase [Burkholderia stagnalis]KWA48407.1 integrase [Burkholderia stagnalis]KWA51734.1 integrase [Burkholderia stagnalis]KWA62715.1 integrase [Burkholderia stagnalis]KWC98354.1 integrase [Burkholderia stagnalis]